MSIPRLAGTAVDDDPVLASLRASDLLALMHEGVVVIATDGRIEHTNAAATKMFGYGPDELLGRHISVLIPARFRTAHARLVHDFVHSAAAPRPMGGRATVRGVRRDGTEFPAQISIAAIPTPVGHVSFAIVRDVSEIEDEYAKLAARDARYRLLFEQAAEGIVELSATGEVVEVNPAALAMFGSRALSVGVLAPALRAYGHDSTGPEGTARLQRGRRGAYEVEFRREDGTTFWGAVTVQGVLEANGDLSRLRMRIVDVTSRVSAERDLRQSEARFKAVLDHSSNAVMVVSDDLALLYANATAAEMFGPAAVADQAGAGRLWELIAAADHETVRRAIFSCKTARESRTTCEFTTVDGDGNVRWFEATFVNLSDDPAVGGVLIQAWDVTEPRQIATELAYNASHDLLTGLYNRAELERRMSRAISEIGRSHLAVGVLFFDLDRFKVLNDSLGHAFGDLVLRTVSARLRRELPDADTIARFGGDEFVVVWRLHLDERDPLWLLARIAERIRTAVAEPMTLDGTDATLTASIGVAVADSPRADPSDLLRDADAALYRAKAEGRNQTAVFDLALRRDVDWRRRIEGDLRAAVANRELVLHAQPIARLGDGRPVGHEVLLRWQRSADDLLLPGEFLSVAEETGLIVEIGRWALDEVGAALVDAGGPRLPGGYMAVNVSPRELADAGFVSSVLDTLDRHGAPAESLVLEITEHASLGDPVTTVAKLRELRRHGVMIAIDDFGTGYSSLSQLLHLPVDILKIDRSFVANLGAPDGGHREAEARSTSLVAAIVALSDSLGITVIAEGIETEAQRTALLLAGCAYGQGWHFGRPQPLTSPPGGRASTTG